MQSLSRLLVAETSLGETMLAVAAITIDAMGSAEMAGISLLDHAGKPTAAIFTAQESADIDAQQFASGAGPCLDAWRLGRPVRIDDTALAAERYPAFARSAQDNGVLSSVSLPLVAGGSGLGALNLYARIPNGFSDEDEAIGADLAATAAVVLANSVAYWEARNLGDQLAEAMRSRAEIEQAKGMLMATLGLGADDAFTLLKRNSQHANIKLRDLAQTLIDTFEEMRKAGLDARKAVEQVLRTDLLGGH